MRVTKRQIRSIISCCFSDDNNLKRFLTNIPGQTILTGKDFRHPEGENASLYPFVMQQAKNQRQAVVFFLPLEYYVFLYNRIAGSSTCSILTKTDFSNARPVFKIHVQLETAAACIIPISVRLSLQPMYQLPKLQAIVSPCFFPNENQ